MVTSVDLIKALPDFMDKMNGDKFLPNSLKEEFLKEAESWDDVLLNDGDKKKLQGKVRDFCHSNKMKSEKSGDANLCYGHCMWSRPFTNYLSKQKKIISKAMEGLSTYKDVFFAKEFDQQKRIVSNDSFYEAEIESKSIYKWCFSEDGSSDSIRLPIKDGLYANTVFPRLAIRKEDEWMYARSVWISFYNFDEDIEIKKPTVFDGGNNALNGNWLPGGYTAPDNPHKGIPEYTFRAERLCMTHVCAKIVERAEI